MGNFKIDWTPHRNYLCVFRIYKLRSSTVTMKALKSLGEKYV